MKHRAVAISVPNTDPVVHVNMQYQMDESKRQFGYGGENESLGSC